MRRFLFACSIFLLVLFIFSPVVRAGDRAISRNGITIRFIERTRTLEFFDEQAGKIFDNGVITACCQGKTIATADSALKLNVTVTKNASELVLNLNNKLRAILCIKDTPGVVINVLGEDLAEVSFRAKAVAARRAWPVILKDSQLNDNKVVFARLGPATFAPARALFDPEYDLAMRFCAAGDVSWQWDNGWKLHTRAVRLGTPNGVTGQELFSMDLLRHYYRDRLGIKYYAPIEKRGYWKTAPVVAMTWYGIQGWKNKPAQTKEWLYPQIDWVAEHLLPYAEKLVFQLDDNYAYRDDNYMRDLSDYIRSRGMIPGIWFTPHAVAPKQVAEEHPDWFLHNADGRLLYTFAGQNWGWDRQQAGVLNINNPDALKTWYEMFWRKSSNRWNFDFFKIDGQPTVAQRYGESVDGGGVEGYRRSLRIGREITGPDKFINGCYGIALDGIGIMNGARTGPDTGHWPHAISIILRWNFLNNVAWWSDPDAAADLYKASLPRVRLNALTRALTGQQFLTDDVWTKVSTEKRRVWQRSFPMLDVYPVNLYPIHKWQDYDLYDLRITRDWGCWDIVGLFNYEGRQAKKVLDLSRLRLPAEKVHVFEYWNSKYMGQFPKDAKITRFLDSYDAEAFAVVAVNEARPVLLSTSRHLSQGGLDLENVHWQRNGKDWIVRGRSAHLVGGDEYVIVFACGRYRVKSAHSPDGPLNVLSNDAIARLQYTPDAARTLDWQVTFGPLRKASLSVAPEQLKLKPPMSASLDLSSIGPEGLQWRAEASDSRIEINPASGSLGPWPAGVKLNVTVRSAGMKPGTLLTERIKIASVDDPSLTREVEVVVQSPPPENLSLRAKARASSVWDKNYAAKYINDGRADTRWNSADGDKDGCRVELSWDEPVTFNRVVIDECEDYGKRVHAWRLEAGTNKAKIIARGKGTVGRNYTIDLDTPITTRGLRLIIEKAATVPTIWELETYNQPR